LLYVRLGGPYDLGKIKTGIHSTPIRILFRAIKHPLVDIIPIPPTC